MRNNVVNRDDVVDEEDDDLYEAIVQSLVTQSVNTGAQMTQAEIEEDRRLLKEVM
jgi:hypothetical protein